MVILWSMSVLLFSLAPSPRHLIRGLVGSQKMIREALTEISNKYLAAKKEDLKSHQLALYIRKCAKNLIKPALGDYAENFVFRSSAGIHQAWSVRK